MILEAASVWNLAVEFVGESANSLAGNRDKMTSRETSVWWLGAPDGTNLLQKLHVDSTPKTRDASNQRNFSCQTSMKNGFFGSNAFLILKDFSKKLMNTNSFLFQKIIATEIPVHKTGHHPTRSWSIYYDQWLPNSSVFSTTTCLEKQTVK